MPNKIIIEKLKTKRKPPSKKVRIVLLGLTPGAQQHKAINESKNLREGAFKGYMRKQMHEWFKELGLAKTLKLESEDSLFTEKRFNESLYITSLLRNPVYTNREGGKKNYTGRSPLPWRNDDLMKCMMETIRSLEKLKQPCLIIPMGQIVSKSLKEFSSLDEMHFILHGFPHPSGANGNRKKEFSKNKKELKKVISFFLNTFSRLFGLVK